MAGATICGCDLGAKDDDFTALSTIYKVPVLYHQCDVTDKEALAVLVQNIISTFGRLDVLVSSAGANFFEGAAKCSENIWEQNMQLNLKSHWQLAKYCKPYLEKNKGVIILMGSNHGNATMPGCFPYNITKSAVKSLVQTLAIEWGPAIRTVGLAPGFIDTPGNQKWFDSFEDSEQARKDTIRSHPVGRIGTPDEVGAWCVFLASDYSCFASGTTYLLDGGRSALM
ncbi:SDR family oxidoreductase [Arachidicoccus ginsenosidivorans]